MEGVTTIPRGDLAEHALQLLEREESFRVFVTARLHVVWYNVAERERAEAECGVEIHDTMLRFRNPVALQQFRGAIAECGALIPVLRLLDAPSSDGHVLVRVARLTLTHAEPVFSATFACAAREAPVRYVDLALVFGLTPAEHRVLKSMLLGQTADQIAQTSATSIETIRTHIRRVYTKIGVASREALFCRLAPYRL